MTRVQGTNTIDHVMPSYDDQTTNPTAGQRDSGSYMSCNLVMYEDGGGGGGGGSSSSGDDSNSSGNGGSDFYDDSGSWSEDGISCVGANASLCGSADEGCYSGDGDKSSSIRGSDGSSNGSSSDCGGGGSGVNRGKWLKSLRTVIDRMVGSESKGRGQKRAVKTILRPPTTYKYVIGMSGFPSKVPVYPKTTM
ncbi:loricrin-like [Melanaphis sacchari]|uniref:loricrin-like n=1 Tax=Melanaphis sacchari TaxID=742174 RepID=UPI000DC15114|nr:loricrin-like [Melanaphis sacchari]